MQHCIVNFASKSFYPANTTKPTSYSQKPNTFLLLCIFIFAVTSLQERPQQQRQRNRWSPPLSTVRLETAAKMQQKTRITEVKLVQLDSLNVQLPLGVNCHPSRNLTLTTPLPPQMIQNNCILNFFSARCYLGCSQIVDFSTFWTSKICSLMACLTLVYCTVHTVRLSPSFWNCWTIDSEYPSLNWIKNFWISEILKF